MANFTVQILSIDIDKKLGTKRWIVVPSKTHVEVGDTVFWTLVCADPGDPTEATVILPAGVFNVSLLELDCGDPTESATVATGTSLGRYGYDVYIGEQSLSGVDGSEPTIIVE